MIDLIMLFVLPFAIPLAIVLNYRRSKSIPWAVGAGLIGHLYIVYWLFVREKGQSIFHGLSQSQVQKFLLVSTVPTIIFLLTLAVEPYVPANDLVLVLSISIIRFAAFVGLFIGPVTGLSIVRRIHT